MGMIGILRRAGEPDLERLLREPSLINPFLADPELLAATAPPRPGFLARLFGRGTAPAPAPAPAFARVEGDEVDVDKAWHGLHYLLTGTAWEGDPPACYLVTGGEEIADEGLGFGSARVVRPANVRDFAAFLAPITRDALLGNYDAAEMRALEIYPDIWDDEGEVCEYLWGYFEDMRAFVADAAARSDGLVIYIG